MLELINFTVKLPLKIEYVAVIGSAPAVYALILVADGKNIAPLPRKNCRYFILNGIGILKLVYMYILEFMLVVFAGFFAIAQ